MTLRRLAPKQFSRSKQSDERGGRQMKSIRSNSAGISRAAAIFTLAFAALVMGTTSALASEMPRTPTPDGAAVYFITPTDGDKVSSPLTVRFGLKGMGVAPAGLDNPNTGHHHLIIDAPLPRPDLPIPNDANHKHFGGGQTEVVLELMPGKHTLQLLLGDMNHVPHTKPLVSKQITITVE
jgi:hypothetical protein